MKKFRGKSDKPRGQRDDQINSYGEKVKLPWKSGGDLLGIHISAFSGPEQKSGKMQRFARNFGGLPCTPRSFVTPAEGREKQQHPNQSMHRIQGSFRSSCQLPNQTRVDSKDGPVRALCKASSMLESQSLYRKRTIHSEGSCVLPSGLPPSLTTKEAESWQA
ncbi:hypothetical protein MJG53_009845 [Ovis ammon polii x Ovis aries]|uniref:Uncharacterized protein n=1 Tax=Ovis ammon polii x Ovis aries TaxID=2918886 RepID=A0ACB9UUY4_9CETA|nr:hypothetical protein MJG53_009845 [Ovis ammon polii x Ovis aries]